MRQAESMTKLTNYALNPLPYSFGPILDQSARADRKTEGDESRTRRRRNGVSEAGKAFAETTTWRQKLQQLDLIGNLVLVPSLTCL